MKLKLKVMYKVETIVEENEEGNRIDKLMKRLSDFMYLYSKHNGIKIKDVFITKD